MLAGAGMRCFTRERAADQLGRELPHAAVVKVRGKGPSPGLGLICLACLGRPFGPKMGQLVWALVGHWAWAPKKKNTNNNNK